MIKPKLISRKEEILAILPVAASIEFRELIPYLWKAENEVVKPVIGAAQMESLADSYEAYVAGNYDENLLTIWETELLIRIQMATVNLAVRSWAPFTIANISTKGITEANGDQKAARESTINRMLESAEADGNASIESILEWLDQNRDQYPDWYDSLEMRAIFNQYIVSAKVFSEYFYIGESRYTFLRIAPQIRAAEKVVDRIIWEMGTELKTEQKQDTLTSQNMTLLRLVQQAVANIAMSDALLMMRFVVSDYGVSLMATNVNNRDTIRSKTPAGDAQLAQIRDKAREDGNAALEAIKNLLYDNIDQYPTFRDGAHYTPEAPAPERFVNESTDKIGIF